MRKTNQKIILVIIVMLFITIIPNFSKAAKVSVGTVKNVKVAERNTDYLKLTWKGVSKATGYKIYVYNSSKKKYEAIGSTKNKTYTLKKLISSKKYKIKIRAYKTIKNKKYFGSYSKVITTATKPTQVKNIKIDSQTDSKIILSFDKVARATGYGAYIYNENTKKYEEKAISTQNSITISNLLQAKTYKIKVRAYKTVNDKKYYGQYSIAIDTFTKPSKIANLQAKSVSIDSITLTWTKLSRVLGYRVYQYNPSAEKYEKLGEVTKNEFVVSKLNPSAGYKFKVRASAIIYSSKKEEDIKKIKEHNTSVEYFIEMKSNKPLEGKDVGLEYLINEGKKLIDLGDNSFEKIEIDPEEFKVLIFTSGTTSNSKGVMLNNRNLAENINAVTAYVKLYPSDRLFSVLPLHHCYESTIGFLYPMSQGASVAVCEGLRYIVPNLQEAHPTAILTVPLLAESLHKKINEKIVKSGKSGMVNAMIAVTNLLKNTGIDVKRKVFKEIYENLGGNLRIIVSAAAPIEKTTGEWLQNIGLLFLQGYGLTETAPIAALTPDYAMNVGSCGKPIVQADIKILDPNENGEGEVLIKTPTLMIGYYEDEEETKKAIDEEGYFHSGDIGYMDENGYIYLTGRSKNVIVTQNGKNIYPEEIEGLLNKADEVKESLIYGKKPEEGSKRDQKELIITARVIPDYDKIKELHGDISEEEIKDVIWQKIKEVNKKLTSYKAIKDFEIKEGEFEKTSTMKIKRYKELNK